MRIHELLAAKVVLALLDEVDLVEDELVRLLELPEAQAARDDDQRSASARSRRVTLNRGSPASTSHCGSDTHPSVGRRARLLALVDGLGGRRLRDGRLRRDGLRDRALRHRRLLHAPRPRDRTRLGLVDRASSSSGSACGNGSGSGATRVIR
jgi:hypothetical protein